MSYVKGGRFKMGDDSFEDSAPQHKLDLPDYLMGKYPVTNSEFSRFIEAGGYDQKKLWCAPGWVMKKEDGWQSPRLWDDGRFNSPNQPVVSISWYETQAYSLWVALEYGKPFLLPSEAQWEKAARGRDGRVYPWGNHSCQTPPIALGEAKRLWQQRRSGFIRPVSAPMGVWTWRAICRSGSVRCGEKGGPNLIFTYPYDPDDGRENTDAGDEVIRVLRGGSWGHVRNYECCAFRRWFNPYYRYELIGFRVAVSPISGR